MPGKISDGRTIDAVAPAGGVVKGRFYRISGWHGVAEVNAAAGETFAMNIDPTFEFSVLVPAGTAAAVGAVLYMPPAGVAGETDLTATITGNVIAFKATVAKDANNYVGGRLLNIA